MDDFGIANAPYFQDMYRDIYPYETGIRLVPNIVDLRPDRLVDCKLLDALIFVDLEGVVHVTLYDKREDYHFFVNRFPDIDSNVSRIQSISTFYGEIVRLFRINTHSESFFENVRKCRLRHTSSFIRDTQNLNFAPPSPNSWTPRKVIHAFQDRKRIKRKSSKNSWMLSSCPRSCRYHAHPRKCTGW